MVEVQLTSAFAVGGEVALRRLLSSQSGDSKMKPLPKWSKHDGRGWRIRAQGDWGLSGLRPMIHPLPFKCRSWVLAS